MTFQRAFPDDGNSPAEFTACCLFFKVADHIAVDFPLPEAATGSGEFEKVTLVTMPKAAIHEDHRLVSRQNDIRSARYRSDMQPEPKSDAMQPSPNCHLGAGVCGPYPGHHP